VGAGLAGFGIGAIVGSALALRRRLLPTFPCLVSASLHPRVRALDIVNQKEHDRAVEAGGFCSHALLRECHQQFLGFVDIGHPPLLFLFGRAGATKITKLAP
jgi:hypothetical protein